MSIFVPATRKITAQAKDTRDNWTLGLVLIVICLINLVLAFASEPFARALQLIGRLS